MSQTAEGAKMLCRAAEYFLVIPAASDRIAGHDDRVVFSVAVTPAVLELPGRTVTGCLTAGEAV
ncbi:hypothetical protein AB0J28_23465 [Streptosporangium canum]|uniref:hypothetical protein n=1 Tax=Streptosporangium canum TaxID=324952 RepID=UPI003423DAC4